jgi:hypothetical protein
MWAFNDLNGKPIEGERGVTLFNGSLFLLGGFWEQ